MARNKEQENKIKEIALECKRVLEARMPNNLNKESKEPLYFDRQLIGIKAYLSNKLLEAVEQYHKDL